MKLRSPIFLFALLVTMSATLLTPSVFSGPPYYHEEGNVNYPGSYFESTYIAMGIGTDDYITMVDVALGERAFLALQPFPDWGVGWGLYNPDADFNEDGVVDMSDITWMCYNWGLNYHYSPFETVSGKPSVKVVAPVGAIQIGQQFTVDIAIKHVENLSAYEFTLSWNPQILKAISVVKGDFISAEWAVGLPIYGENYLYVGGWRYQPTTQSGSGTLAIITFECLDKGKATIDLSSRLFDIDLKPMPHKDIDGAVTQRP